MFGEVSHQPAPGANMLMPLDTQTKTEDEMISLFVASVAVACADIAIVSAFVRRPASVGVMSAVAGCVMTAAVSDVRHAAPLSSVGRDRRESQAESQAESKSKCKPFHGGALSCQWFQHLSWRER